MKKLLLTLSFLTLIIQANAQWSGDPAVNNLIANNTSLSTIKTSVTSINDGNGNIIIAWAGTSVGSTGIDIFVQKINKDGLFPWGTTEKVVCNAVGTQTAIAMVSDGKGGAILTWSDYRFATAPGTSASNADEVFGQRVKANGTMGWTANGVILSAAGADATKYRRTPAIEKVSDKDFVVVWSQLGTLVDLYAQKVDTLGVLQWATDVSVHGVQTRSQGNQSIVSDGTGGAIIVFYEPKLATTNADIYGQRISSAGSLLWGAAGIPICDAPTNQTTPVAITDGSGGVVATWTDFRNGDNDIYAQRLDIDGNRLWTNGLPADANYLNGVPIVVINTPLPEGVSGSIRNQVAPQIISDLNNNFVITWTDDRNSQPPLSYGFDVYAQKINLSGARQWTNGLSTDENYLNGIPVVSRTGTQGNSGGGDVILSNGLNGDVFVTFRDVVPALTGPPAVASHNDIYVQRLNSSNGAVSSPFNVNGVPVSTNNATAAQYNVISDGAGGLVIAWLDSRSGTASEIYASRLYSNGTLPVTYKSISANLNGNQNVLVKWEIASEINTENYVIERASDDGVFVAIGTVKAAKLSNYQFLDIYPITGNSYYRIKAVDFDGVISLSSNAVVKIATLNQITVTVYPNPVTEVLNIFVGNTDAKNTSYLVNVFDVNGQLKLSKSVSATANNAITIAVDGLATGVYTIQLADANNAVISVKKVIKL